MDFISKLLKPDKTQRLGHNGAQEIRDHPFLSSISWDNLYEESMDKMFVPNPKDDLDTSYFLSNLHSLILISKAKEDISINGSFITPQVIQIEDDFDGFDFVNVEKLNDLNTRVIKKSEDEIPEM